MTYHLPPDRISYLFGDVLHLLKVFEEHLVIFSSFLNVESH